MKSSLRLLGIFVFAWGVFGSCTHIDRASRTLASSDDEYAKACKDMTKGELKAFRRFVRSDRGMGQSMTFLGELAHDFRIDRNVYQRDQMTMEAFLSEDHGILYSWVKTYADIVLEHCYIVRDGETPSICTTPEHTSKRAYLDYGKRNNASQLEELNKQIAAKGWNDLETLEFAHTITSGVCRYEIDYVAFQLALKEPEFNSYIQANCKDFPAKQIAAATRKTGWSDKATDLIVKSCGQSNLYEFTRMMLKYGWSHERIKNTVLGLDFYECGCGKYIPQAYRKAQLYCGPHDAKLKAKDRFYPKLTRDWIDHEHDGDPDINSWVITNSGLWDKDKNEFISSDDALKLCDDFKKVKSKGHWVKGFSNAEDAVDNLYRCLNAFDLTRMELYYETDSKTGRLKRDDKGELIPREAKTKTQRTKHLAVCLEGYSRGKVDADEEGNPKEAPPPPAPASTGDSKGKGRDGDKTGTQSFGTDKDAKHKASAPPPAPNLTLTPGDSNNPEMKGEAKGEFGATGSNDGERREKPCLPGDNPGHARCLSDDSCVREFAGKAERGGWKIPSDLSTTDLLSMYKKERPDYIKALAQHQSELLAMGYVTDAFQRYWDTPAQFNQNLDAFINMSKDSDIKKHLVTVMAEEKMNPTVEDGAADPMFSSQRFNYDTLGRQMVEAVRRIHHMRPFLGMLHRDLGAAEISTAAWFPKMSGELYAILSLVPHFWPVATYLYYIGGQDMAISFNNHTKYQCNMFSTMSGDDWVTRTDSLITMSDREIRKLYDNPVTREAAFCEKDDQGRVTQCDVPKEFERYLEATSPKAFDADETRKKNHEFWAKEIPAARARGDAPDKIARYEARYRLSALPLKDVQARLAAIRKSAMEIKNRIGLDNHGADAAKWLPRQIEKLREKNRKAPSASLEKAIAEYEAKLKVVTEFDDLQGEVAPFQIHLRDWCDMRYEAAISLQRASDTLATFYPVLAHVDEVKGDKNRKGRPYAEELADALKKIEGNKALTKDQVKTKLEALYKQAAAKAARVLPEAQESLKKYLAKVTELSDESAYQAILNGSMSAGFTYCAEGASDNYGLPCSQREEFVSCKMKAEAKHWMDEQQLPQFYQEVFGTVLNVVPALGAASGGLKLAFTAKGVFWGVATAATLTGANYGFTKYIAKKNSARWVDYYNAVGALALEGVDSYANAIATLAAANPEFPLKDFIFGFVLGSVGSGLGNHGKSSPVPEGVLREVALKITEHAEGKITRTQLTEFIAERAGAHPELLDALPSAFAEQLGSMSDGMYQKVFDGPQGTLAATRARKTMGVWMSGNAIKLFKAIEGWKQKFQIMLLDEKNLNLDEWTLLETKMEAVDFATLADNLGPREVALLSRDLDNLIKSMKNDKPASQVEKIGDFLRKVCAAAAACTSLSGLRGCPK